jgi:hypothetical protein
MALFSKALPNSQKPVVHHLPACSACWTSWPYVGTCGQRCALTHMHPLRRHLDHRGSAFGLTRFACQTAVFQKCMGRRGFRRQSLPDEHCPQSLRSVWTARMSGFYAKHESEAKTAARPFAFAQTAAGSALVARAKPWGATRSEAGRSPPWGTCHPPSGGLLIPLSDSCHGRFSWSGLAAASPARPPS